MGVKVVAAFGENSSPKPCLHNLSSDFLLRLW
jgi:hypothetical protein